MQTSETRENPWCGHSAEAMNAFLILSQFIWLHTTASILIAKTETVRHEIYPCPKKPQQLSTAAQIIFNEPSLFPLLSSSTMGENIHSNLIVECFWGWPNGKFLMTFFPSLKVSLYKALFISPSINKQTTQFFTTRKKSRETKIIWQQVGGGERN